MIDGKPINNSQYTFDPLNPAQNRDPRFNNTVIYDGALVPADDTYSATTVVNTWIGVGRQAMPYTKALPPVLCTQGM